MQKGKGVKKPENKNEYFDYNDYDANDFFFGANKTIYREKDNVHERNIKINGK